MGWTPLPAAAAALLAVAALAPVARASTIEELTRRQSNGLWEASIRGGNGRPLAFCVTDHVKVAALRQTREAMAQFGCRTDRDVVAGDRFEMRLACSNPDPNVGTFHVTMTGEMRPRFLRGAGTITGGGPLVQVFARSPELRGFEWRWVRPCLPGEKPGLQAG